VTPAERTLLMLAAVLAWVLVLSLAGRADR